MVEEQLGIKGGETTSIKKWMWGFGLLIIVAGLFGWWFLAGGSGEPVYITSEITRGRLKSTVSATGNLEAVNTIEVGSEVSGLIESVFVDYNDKVTSGELLTQLDTDRLKAEVVQAKASLNAARASLKQAEASFEEQRLITQRIEHLAAKDLTSTQDLESAEAALQRFEASVASANAQIEVNEATLQMARTQLEKAYIRSPINGIVLTRNVESGQAVAASFQTPVLFTLAEDLTRMELHVDIDEADIGQVTVGQEAIFTVDAFPDTSFPAKIINVYYASQTVSDVVTYNAILSVNNSSMMLRPGMTATADITIQEVEQALLVPNAALRFTPPNVKRPEESQSLVWIIEDNQLKSIPVKTGITDERNTVLLEGNLREGQQILVNLQVEE